MSCCSLVNSATGTDIRISASRRRLDLQLVEPLPPSDRGERATIDRQARSRRRVVSISAARETRAWTSAAGLVEEDARSAPGSEPASSRSTPSSPRRTGLAVDVGRDLRNASQSRSTARRTGGGRLHHGRSATASIGELSRTISSSNPAAARRRPSRAWKPMAGAPRARGELALPVAQVGACSDLDLDGCGTTSTIWSRRLAGDQAPRLQATSRPTRVQQAWQVVVDLGDGPDRRGAEHRGRLLVDRDERREPVDGIDDEYPSSAGAWRA